MLNIAIVENDKLQAERLKDYIERFGEENGEAVRAVWFRDGVDFISDYSGEFDGVFMDIDMPLMDGMTAAEKLRETDGEVCIVFVTDLAQYALRGYKVNAMDYLVKPVDYFELAVELKKILRSKKLHGDEYMWISVPGVRKRVAIGDIVYVDILAHDVHVHYTEDGGSGEAVFRGTLKDIEAQLDGKPFSRCHNCCIVNLRCVRTVCGDEVLLDGGDRVYISRNRRKKFMTDLTSYIAGNGGYSKKHGGGYNLCLPIPSVLFRTRDLRRSSSSCS